VDATRSAVPVVNTASTRIASLMPAATEMVAAIGHADDLVAALRRRSARRP